MADHGERATAPRGREAGLGGLAALLLAAGLMISPAAVAQDGDSTAAVGSDEPAASPDGKPEWYDDLETMMREEHDCDVSDITYVTFGMAPTGMVFATVDCRNTRSFSVTRQGDQDFVVNR